MKQNIGYKLLLPTRPTLIMHVMSTMMEHSIIIMHIMVIMACARLM